MGFRQVNPYWKGQDVRVALIDSGLAVHSHELAPAGGFNTLENQDPTAWNVDEQGHGTHCAGVVAARAEARGVLGGAEAASVYAVKVFPGGFTSNLVEAVEWCIENQIDIISMSLGSPTPSEVLRMALRSAYDRGITAVAAAGNESTHVSYPAAFPTVFAVSAIGRFGTFPEDSGHALKVSSIRDARGGLFAATFNNFGPEVMVCAPGVAVLSTVPTGFAAWDGTSMACPMVSALAALVLEAYPQIRSGRADQVEWMRSVLNYASVPLGMGPGIEGSGLPMAPRALAGARPRPTAMQSWPQA
jgi:subtilisin family serine protease